MFPKEKQELGTDGQAQNNKTQQVMSPRKAMPDFSKLPKCKEELIQYPSGGWLAQMKTYLKTAQVFILCEVKMEEDCSDTDEIARRAFACELLRSSMSKPMVHLYCEEEDPYVIWKDILTRFEQGKANGKTLLRTEFNELSLSMTADGINKYFQRMQEIQITSLSGI